MVAAGILLSRLFGLVRQRVFGHYFGASASADAFMAAVDHIEKRLQGHLKQRETTELKQIVHARLAVLPEGKSQERVVSVASFRARYGDEFLTSVAAAIAAWYDAALEGEPVPS